MSELQESRDTFWVLEKTEDSRFPYRISLVQDGKLLLQLLVQDKWPGPKGNVFCLREEVWDLPRPECEIERVPVLSLHQYGKRLSVVLDRYQQKRCDFLFLKKPYKTRAGEYEVIFWQTQQALKERKTRSLLTAQGHGGFHVLIDTAERYAWKFSGCHVESRRLPAGDYALLCQDRISALVERKTYDNLLAEFRRIKAFHQQLGELTSFPQSALVIEANYSDFLQPEKLIYYKPSFAAKVIAELHALHPGLSVVFAGNRKLANEWTMRFFGSVASQSDEEASPTVRQAVSQYGEVPLRRAAGTLEMERVIIEEMPELFTFKELAVRLPGYPSGGLRRALAELGAEGRVILTCRGIHAQWKKTL